MIEVYDQWGGDYNVNKEIRVKTSMLRSATNNANNNEFGEKKLIFKK